MQTFPIGQMWIILHNVYTLFHDDRGVKPAIPKNMDGPKILRSDIQEALKKMKRHKAARPDEIVTELITSLEEYGVNKVVDTINEIYDTGEISENLCISIS